MSRYKRRRRFSAYSGNRSAVVDTIKVFLVVFLLISLIPLLFSKRYSRGDFTEPSVDLESPTDTPFSDDVDFIGYEITDNLDGDWQNWEQWFE